MSNELELTHEELLQEENLSVKDLPANLQQQIRGLNLQKKKYEQNPNENQQIRLKRLSLELAEKIQNHLDQMDEEEENSDNNEEAKVESKPVDKKGTNLTNHSLKKESKNVAKQDEPKETTKSPVKNGFGNLVMEKKIMSITNAKNGKINISDLTKIIGKEPDYPEQIVHTIKLRKVFLSAQYRIVK